MAYSKQTWTTGSIVSPAGPVNGPRLTHMEDGIFLAHTTIDNHVASAADVHTQYVLKTQKNVANGVAGLGANARLAPAQMAQAPNAYTITNAAARRVIDANNFTLEQLMDFVATMAADMKTVGVLA